MREPVDALGVGVATGGGSCRWVSSPAHEPHAGVAIASTIAKVIRFTRES
jgi:hypothetical protein